MENNKIDLRSRRTRKLLCKALFNLLTEKSMDNIKINDICEKAMVHRTTFYKHFSDKYDLFEYLIQSEESEIFADMGKIEDYVIPMDYYMHLITLALDYVGKNRDSLLKILRVNNDDMVNILLYGTLERELSLILKAQNVDFGMPIKIISNFYVGGFVALAICWITMPNNYSYEDMVKYTEKLISTQIK